MLRDPASVWEMLESAECVCTAEEASRVVTCLARDISSQLAAEFPLVLAVMNGAMVFCGQLLPQLKFPLEVGHIHVTRYGGSTHGGALQWNSFPERAVEGRVVLAVDDVLDEGQTLAAIKERVLAAGAKRCYTAVFADKEVGVSRAIVPDFVGKRFDNRYLFGFGMDIEGMWRNLPAVYAVKGVGQ